ncbi:MAG: hypothetical protein H8D05_00270 [FCB group bacterium]|nr:hypothetical protein [FCB group bacterium]
MKLYYLFFLVFLVTVCMGSVSYDFTELPEGWTAEYPWYFSSAGANIHIVAYGKPEQSVTRRIESDSAPLIVTQGTTTVHVVLESTWELYGQYWTGEWYSRIWGRAFVNGEDNYTIVYECESGGFEGDFRSAKMDEEKETSEVFIPVSEGDLVTFCFEARADAFGAKAEVEWNITHLSVSGVTTSLDRSTWADIKACF